MSTSEAPRLRNRVRPTGVAVVVGLALLAAPATGHATTVETGLSKAPKVRPKKMCVASVVCLDKIRWSRWGSTKAVARGRLRLYERDTTGKIKLSPTPITLSRPRSGSFTRIQWRYADGSRGWSDYFKTSEDFGQWVIQG